LDEIGDMPLNLQVKLLRVLQEGIVQRIGSNRNISVDLRVIAATHEDLEQLVTEGKFRQDLYYRLKVFVIKIPPLRERIGDVKLLIDYFIPYYSSKAGRKVTGIDKSALNILYEYQYPGNVRELQHIIESAIVICKDNVLNVDDLPREIYTQNRDLTLTGEHFAVPKNNEELKTAKTDAIRKIELMFLNEILSSTDGNVSEAARKAGINRSWLIDLINKYNIDLRQF